MIYPKVTIKSDRPAMTGGSVNGKSGEGVVLPDDETTVYVKGPAREGNWYGAWPVEETNLAELKSGKSTSEPIEAFNWVQEFLNNPVVINPSGDESRAEAVKELVALLEATRMRK